MTKNTASGYEPSIPQSLVECSTGYATAGGQLFMIVAQKLFLNILKILKRKFSEFSTSVLQSRDGPML
jgi:hypothetical protein